MKIVILLPAYNEETSIPTVLAAINETMRRHEFTYEVLVCNDGSEDHSGSVLKELSKTLPITVLSHKLNRGLGETIRDLLELAVERNNPDDIIVRLDCDDTHEPEAIPRLIQKLEEGYDVVIASRFQDSGGQMGVSRYRRSISFGANVFMKLFFPMKGIREYSCGFRAYRASVIQDAIACFGNNFIQLRGLGFTCTLEKLVKLRMMKCRFAEVPFLLRYDKKCGPSKIVGSSGLSRMVC